jgi:ERCC4-type nuclease
MSPLNSRFVGPGTGRLVVKRDGSSILRSAKVPKPVVLVDTREQQPFPLRANHPNWICGERRATLKTGDYTIEGMEDLLALERKNLADLVACVVTYSARFIASCERLSKFRWKAVLIEASLAGTMQLKRATAWEVIGIDEKEPIAGRQSASPNGGGGI